MTLIRRALTTALRIPPNSRLHVAPIANTIRTMSSSGFPSAKLPESLASLSPAAQPKLHLYTAPTPNGFKVSIILEELLLAYPDAKEIQYDFYQLSFDNNDQKSEQYLKINPNGRIPGLVDDNHGGHNVFETASIMIWLVEVSPVYKQGRAGDRR